ncbi:cell division protein FtsA [Aerococcus urinaehominis]|uniref:Cell division protein FtsA n=1 Tax=Aerococcus urinaehominis TaxID=128944 RepID=A0A0X8FLR9_9LACT|nr:cell division protein FtsA [Aerococcus urinaehominis]AMB99663.1 cell division protein FtsA [Aerococcus urinaehominis]SDL89448.1 cell division protein FtsA [Aerococcus urinaehominis]
MVQPQIHVSLDIGTTSIKVIVAEFINGQLNVIGVGTERSHGLSRGVIVDIDQTVSAIKAAVDQAQQKSGHKITEVVVGVPSNQINIEPCYGMIAVNSDNKEITSQDVKNVLQAAKVRAVPPEREIISVLPEEFIVDGFDGIRDPRGMIGVRLELYASLITGPKTITHNIRRCVESAGLKIKDFVVQPLAISQVALSESEREFGTILIDLGGGQSSASVMHDNQLKFSFVDQEGGQHVTSDISQILNTTMDSAERIKREYGYAIPEDTSSEEFFPVQTVGSKEPVKIDERYLSEIIEARLRQIFETLKKALDQVEAFDLPGNVVLTGGGVSLPGLVELAEEVFGTEVKVYIPEYVGLRSPIYATGVGLIQYTEQLADVYQLTQEEASIDKAPTEESRRQQSVNRPVEVVNHRQTSRPEPAPEQSTVRVEKHDQAGPTDDQVENQNQGHQEKPQSFGEKIRKFIDEAFS